MLGTLMTQIAFGKSRIYTDKISGHLRFRLRIRIYPRSELRMLGTLMTQIAFGKTRIYTD